MLLHQNLHMVAAEQQEDWLLIEKTSQRHFKGILESVMAKLTGSSSTGVRLTKVVLTLVRNLALILVLVPVLVVFLVLVLVLVLVTFCPAPAD